ncbi:MAG TPA: OB-fold domain-containing protein [Acidimicrobiales bacterium]|nr:OB-fold domain-containing protein [Acidimicrobiales bacterium]
MTPDPVTPRTGAVGIVGVGAAAPTLRLAMAEVGKAWAAGGGKGTVAVCESDEDTLTLAWEATTRALAAAGIEATDISGLWWGTSRPPLAEGPSHAMLTTALGCAPDIAGALCAGSPHAGMEALVGAWDAIGAGGAGPVVVVASDALVPGLGTAGEVTTGAGAVALVLGAPGDNGSAPAARLVARTTRSMAVVDRYRGDGDYATGDVYDGRLFREEVFIPLLADTGKALAGDTTTALPTTWALSDPDGKLGAAVAKRLGGAAGGGDIQGALGDTGAAAALLKAAAAMAEPGALGVIGYGGGRATAVTVEVAKPVPGAADVPAALAGGTTVPYTHVLKARGQLSPQADPIPMGVPPASAAFVRGAREMLSLEGARCRACGTVSTPPSIHPTCIACGSAEFDVVPLARRGTVQTFVVNQTMPPPFTAPLPLIVLDFEDGARLMLQGVPGDAGALAIGDPVVLTLRRYAVERGIPVYGYKALRAQDAPAPDEATAAVGAEG